MTTRPRRRLWWILAGSLTAVAAIVVATVVLLTGGDECDDLGERLADDVREIADGGDPDPLPPECNRELRDLLND